MRDTFVRKRFLFAFVASVTLSLLLVYMLIDIIKKKEEAKTPYHHVNQITDDMEDPAQWGINFPHQYASYLKTVDQVRTRFGGSEALPKAPTEEDPRTQVSQSRLEEDPRLKTFWSGYGFAVDFREERGHAYMFTDQKYTERQKKPQPGTCLNCHASTYLTMKRLGNGDIFKGFEEMNQLPYQQAAGHAKHAVACIDCHTPGSMRLRITRPAFIEGIKKLKAYEGIPDYDVAKSAAPQEMRTFVCAQCHVEYYFKGPKKRLTFPWDNGLQADKILQHYNKIDHSDWTHKISKASSLKAQHPEFEMYSQGIHARSGVSCTDCHMPYKKVGAIKITDHHIQSPVLNLARACQTCHRWPEKELKARVENIQERTFELRGIALDAVNELISDIRDGVNVEQEKLEQARHFQREAQFLLDFVEAENSMGFHAPGEALRLLGLSIEKTRKGQKALK